MTNQEVCNAFVKGINAHSLNMRSEGGKLFSYRTIIAEHTTTGDILLNATKYSVTTSKQQGNLRKAIERYHYGKTILVNNVPRCAQSLEKFAK